MNKPVLIALALVAFIGGSYGGVLLFGKPAEAPTEEETAAEHPPTEEVAAVEFDSLAAAADSLATGDSLGAHEGALDPGAPGALAADAHAGATPPAADPWPATAAAGGGARPPRLAITDISATLSRLDDRALRPVLAQLDADVLDQLISQASARERTRLLAALPADRAARLVERLATGQVRRPDPPQRTAAATRPRPAAAAPAPAPAPADTTASASH